MPRIIKKSKTEIVVQVPATTANMGPGFDCLGLALDWWNTIQVEMITRGLEFEIKGIDREHVPCDASNLTFQAIQIAFRAGNRKMPPLRIKINCRIPIARGLGSSASAIVGGLAVANELLEKRFSLQEMLEMATKMEGHPDNVAPALLGGLVVSVQTGKGIVAARLDMPPGLRTIIFVPYQVLTTQKARGVLPLRISRADAIFNASRTALWIAAVQARKWEWLDAATQDRLHQPHRAKLVPGMNRLMSASMRAGARGVALSGAGPSVIAFSDRNLDRIAKSMERAGVPGAAHIVRISNRGTHLT